MGINFCKRKRIPNEIQNGDENLQTKIIEEKKEIKEPISHNNIKLFIIKKAKHSKKNDKIEEVIKAPYLENTIIIGCRSGDIKEVSEITSENNSKIIILYSCLKRLYSLILLQQQNKLCIGLDNEILIIKFNLDGKHIFEKDIIIKLEEEGPIYALLELKNEKIISAGKNIILWGKKTTSAYIKIKTISIGNSRITNLIEFPFYNTIFAIQENTHRIFFFKNYTQSIELIQIIENVPSIFYKGSTQNLSKSAMILVGKFELNVIDGKNGDIISRYPGMDRGALLKINLKGMKNNMWIVRSLTGNIFEFFEQEGNDLIFYEKVEIQPNESLGWGHKLVKMTDEYFVETNHSGNIFVYKISI